jgi:hypothetical protein
MGTLYVAPINARLTYQIYLSYSNIELAIFRYVKVESEVQAISMASNIDKFGPCLEGLKQNIIRYKTEDKIGTYIQMRLTVSLDSIHDLMVVYYVLILGVIELRI